MYKIHVCVCIYMSIGISIYMYMYVYLSTVINTDACSWNVPQGSGHKRSLCDDNVDNRFLINLQVVVKKVSSSERASLEAEDPDRTHLVETIIQRNMGFTSLFHYMVQLKKPIVLHNCLLDLMLIYKQVCFIHLYKADN